MAIGATENLPSTHIFQVRFVNLQGCFCGGFNYTIVKGSIGDRHSQFWWRFGRGYDKPRVMGVVVAPSILSRWYKLDIVIYNFPMIFHTTTSVHMAHQPKKMWMMNWNWESLPTNWSWISYVLFFAWDFLHRTFMKLSSHFGTRTVTDVPAWSFKKKRPSFLSCVVSLGMRHPRMQNIITWFWNFAFREPGISGKSFESARMLQGR